jgi:hypothetical protein
MWTLLGILILGLYVVTPIVIYAQQRSPAADDAIAPLADTDNANLTDESRSYLDGAEAALQREGFGPPARLVWRGTAKMVSYLSVLEHQDHSAVAVAMAVQVRASSRTVVRCVLNLRSDFPDGRSMFTSNTKTGSAFPKNPRHDSQRFPTMTDPPALWRVHRLRVQKRGATVRPTVDGDLIGYVKRELEDGQKRWTVIGYYSRMTNGGVRPTMRGALLMVWRLLPPWKQINDWRDAKSQVAFD